MTYKEIDMTNLIPKRDTKDTIIFNQSPHISDIEKARDENKVIICNSQSNYTLSLIEGLPDDLKMYVILFDKQMSDSEFKEFILKQIEKEEKLSWIRMGY